MGWLQEVGDPRIIPVDHFDYTEDRGWMVYGNDKSIAEDRKIKGRVFIRRLRGERLTDEQKLRANNGRGCWRGPSALCRGKVWLSSTPKTNKEWAPMAVLVKNLPTLTDVISADDNILPPCLLAVVEHHPHKSRLHIDVLRLHCMKNRKGPGTITPHELAIATSPSLHSIKFNMPDPVDNHLKAILNMVRDSAPNLKEATYIFCRAPQTAARMSNESRHPSASWKKCVTDGGRKREARKTGTGSGGGRGILGIGGV